MVDITEHLFTLPSKSRFYHVYNSNYPAGSFNGSGLGDRRFDPILDEEGNVIPTLYAADHYIDAFAETMMRKMDSGKREFTGDPNVSGLLQFDTTRKLTLVDVSSINKYTDPLHQGQSAYGELQLFTAWVAINNKKIHGLSWYGYQRGIDGHRCSMFFGDRVLSKQLTQRIDEELISPTANQKLKDAAIALNCSLPETLL